MSLSLYEISIPVMMNQLGNLAALLSKARAHADARQIPHESLLNARLIDDMMSLTGQVQRASDTAKGTAVRVGGVANISMPDRETSFDELEGRIVATINFLRVVPPTAYEGKDDADVTLPVPSGPRVYTGRTYVLEYALPNFLFHVTTAYDLMRSRGVPLGKADFLGWR